MKVKYIKLNYFFISLLVILTSCSETHDEKEYYPSGNLKSLKMYNYGNDKLEKTIYYYDVSGDKKIEVIYHKTNCDSILYYYDNGRVFKTGKQDKKGYYFNKWNYYTREGLLSDTKEFFVINNKFGKRSVLNQQWYYNQKGDTMFYGNNRFNVYKQKEFELESKGEKTSGFIYFHFYPKGDTLSIAEPLICTAETAYPAFGAENSESYVVLAKEKFNFNSDFSNEAQVKGDTFPCLAKDKVNGYKFPKADKKHTVVFGRWFDTPGKKIVRGYMVEYYKRKPTPDNDNVRYETQVYFEKVIYVKDTIK